MRLSTLAGVAAILAMCPAVAFGQAKPATATTKPSVVDSVHRAPAASDAKLATPKGSVVSARCNDGTVFSGTSTRGACSSHQGVKTWLTRGTAPPPKNATARCGDGSFWTKVERRGACAKHGGVKEWLKT